MFIRLVDGLYFSLPPKVYKKPNGGTVSNFDKLTNAERIERYGVYPVTGEPELAWWQSKSNPQYTFTETQAQVSYTITEMSLAERQEYLVERIYMRAADLLNSRTGGYGLPEVAAWPALRAEIKQYNVDSSIGVNMQAVIDEGLHTASTLSAKLTPEVDFYDAVIAARNDKIMLVNAATLATIVDIDVEAGWPVVAV